MNRDNIFAPLLTDLEITELNACRQQAFETAIAFMRVHRESEFEANQYAAERAEASDASKAAEKSASVASNCDYGGEEWPPLNAKFLAIGIAFVAIVAGLSKFVPWGWSTWIP